MALDPHARIRVRAMMPPSEIELRAWCESNEVEVVDYRDLSVWPRRQVYHGHGYPLDKSRAHPPRKPLRPWAQITALMLHTTAVAGMTAKRGLGLPAHLYVPREPAIVLCHDLERLLYHGHAGNKRSIGVEISGVSAWDEPSQVERVRALLRYFRSRRREELGPDALCEVMAHRQTHKSRVKDPGAQIWRDAGEWAIAELGYQLGPVLDTGRSVDEWRVS